MSQHILKIRDRGIQIDLVVSSEAYVDCDGTTIFGKSPNNASLTPKWQLTKRPPHVSTAKGSKAYQESEKIVTDFESKFPADFKEKYWNRVMDHMHFMNLTYRADYLATLPTDKPIDRMIESTKKFLVDGSCEQNEENVSAIRNLFRAYMENCDRFAKLEPKKLVKKEESPDKWLNRAKSLHTEKE